MSQVISATDARNNFSEILSQVIYNQREFIVEKKGKKVAMVIPFMITKNSGKKKSLVVEKLTKFNMRLSGWTKAKKLLQDIHEPHI